jgi:hypothetical protein
MNNVVYMWAVGQVPSHTERLGLSATIRYFDPAETYAADTVFYYDMYGPHHEKIPQQLAQGYRIIFDAKNEHYIHFSLHWVFLEFLQHPGQGLILISGESARQIPGVTVVAVPTWYWIMDQQPLQYFQLHKYQPRPAVTHRFLMTIEKIRPERDYLCDQLADLLPQSLYSYRHRGVFLPNDWTEHMGGPYQRYVNPAWLDATPFTLVVETYIDDSATSGFSLTTNDRHFLCEKSYKPMACKHPFIMASTQGNLAYLRSQGFESFPELFDESYDDIADWRERVDRVVELVRDFDVRSVDNPRTKEKLLHNSARFFDQQLTQQMTQQSIVGPLMNFIAG